jgi:hypothetical protein
MGAAFSLPAPRKRGKGSAVEDPAILDEIKGAMKEKGVRGKPLVYIRYDD